MGNCNLYRRLNLLRMAKKIRSSEWKLYALVAESSGCSFEFRSCSHVCNVVLSVLHVLCTWCPKAERREALLTFLMALGEQVSPKGAVSRKQNSLHHSFVRDFIPNLSLSTTLLSRPVHLFFPPPLCNPPETHSKSAKEPRCTWYPIWKCRKTCVKHLPNKGKRPWSYYSPGQVCPPITQHLWQQSERRHVEHHPKKVTPVSSNLLGLEGYWWHSRSPAERQPTRSLGFNQWVLLFAAKLPWSSWDKGRVVPGSWYASMDDIPGHPSICSVSWNVQSSRLLKGRS